MAANPEQFATHEAGHAVMQWFVGWESELQWIQMCRIDGGVTDGGMKAKPPFPATLSVARSRLLVLFAGTAATNARFGPGILDVDRDWQEVPKVARQFFKRPVKWIPSNGLNLEDDEANELVRESMKISDQIVKEPNLAATIDAVATLLLNVEPDDDGLCVVYGNEIVEACERKCGDVVRRNNRWVDWIGGNRGD